MKKSVIVIVIICLLASCMLLFSNFGKQHKEENVGREVSIRWEMVNLRESYSTTSDVIAELHQGTKVYLTGNSYDYISAEDLPTETWQEVRTASGKTGWIVTESIKW